ncbi:Complex III assembly protein translocase and chaperone [Elasticomyces elasticus]|nr:Complex III assembly protein translocase and chaperone [Elasticomyces elasticus]
MDGDGVRADAIPAVVGSPGPTSSKSDVVKQLAALGGGDGSVFSQLLNNPFFTAGFGLAGLGVLYGMALEGYSKLSYDWVLNWMTAQYQVGASSSSVQTGIMERTIRRFMPGLHHLQIETSTLKSASGTEKTAFSLVPGHGKHILRYRNAFIAVSRERVDRNFDAMGKPFETVRLTTLYSHRHIFEDIVREAFEMAVRSTEGKTVVFTSQNMSWQASGQPKRRRPFDSVVLEKGLAESVLSDVHEFLDARTWYLDRGIPYRRGYLLYGPPGTGKTSFCQALAGELDFNIAMLSLSQRGLTDDLLNHLLLNVPPRTLVLLEDADAAFSNRRQTESDGYSGANVTYSGLLNALDGVASAEERMIFMTTNHIDRLDDALIRPGRVDMTVHLDNATEWQMEKLWDRFYGEQDVTGEGKRRFLARATSAGLPGNVSTAALQGLFLYNKGNVEGAIDMVDQLRASAGTKSRSPTGIA